jgi:hypothetical protein
MSRFLQNYPIVDRWHKNQTGRIRPIWPEGSTNVALGCLPCGRPPIWQGGRTISTTNVAVSSRLSALQAATHFFKIRIRFQPEVFKHHWDGRSPGVEWK